MPLGLCRRTAGVFLWRYEMKKIFGELTKKDALLWIVSVIIVTVSNVIVRRFDVITFVSTLTGITALIFTAKGNVWGQVVMVLFCLLYAIISYRFKYYGEMMTYMFMSLPIAVFSIVTWVKNPYKKGNNVVKIRRMTWRECALMFGTGIFITVVFYFILKAFNTPNLEVSTFSVLTSYCAAYLSFRRISYYALAYAANDLVLIVLWILASIADFGYIPVVVCFALFFVYDMYGLICWKSREKIQRQDI